METSKSTEVVTEIYSNMIISDLMWSWVNPKVYTMYEEHKIKGLRALNFNIVSNLNPHTDIHEERAHRL